MREMYKSQRRKKTQSKVTSNKGRPGGSYSTKYNWLGESVPLTISVPIMMKHWLRNQVANLSELAQDLLYQYMTAHGYDMDDEPDWKGIEREFGVDEERARQMVYGDPMGKIEVEENAPWRGPLFRKGEEKKSEPEVLP
jgi:hypothetical protein